MNPNYSDHLDLARKLHETNVVIDTHCDTTQFLLNADWSLADRHDTGHVDIPRMKEGGLDAVFLAVYAARPERPGDGVRAARRQLTAIHAAVGQHADQLVLARTAADIRTSRKAGKIAVLIGIEGGYLLEDSLDVLREYRRAGASYLTLTHGFHTSWADSSGVHADLAPLHNGLAPFGKEVVHELNRLGMMIDVSHASDKTFWDALELSQAPIIATHSSCRAVSGHRRNVSDEMIKAMAAAGGLIQINFASAFIDPGFPPIDVAALAAWRADKSRPRPSFLEHRTSLEVLADHFDHALQLVGPDHVGLGTDFDGVPSVPDGMQDCSMLPNLTAALLARGYGQDDLTKVLGGNVLSLMDRVQQVGAGRQTEPA